MEFIHRMSALYFVESTDGTFSFVIQPATIDGPTAVNHHTDLKLVGSGMHGWGQSYVQNFFRLLENFACEEKIVSGKPVPKDMSDLGVNKGVNDPVIGQTWFNKTRNVMYVYDGTDWVSVSPLGTGTTPPSTPMIGQLWYDTNSDPYTSPVNNVNALGVLKVYDGSTYVDVALPITDTLFPLSGGTLYGGMSTGGETLPDVDAGGICINHGSNDGNSLTIKNADVVHSFTSVAESDTYFRVRKNLASNGGALLQGFSTSYIGSSTEAFSTNPDTRSLGLSGVGTVNLSGYKASGTVAVQLSSNENLFSVANGGVTKLLLKGNGDLDLAGNINSNTLTVTGLASSSAALASIVNNSHLTTKEYVDTSITTALNNYTTTNSIFEPVSGNWFNNGIVRVHTDGGSEIGKYIDMHYTDSSVANADIRIDMTAANVLRIWDTNSTHGQTLFDVNSGQHYQMSNVVGGTQMFTLADRNIVSDSQYPVGSDQYEFLMVGKYDNTKGGARIRSYMKNGTNFAGPGLLLEAIKADDGQLFSENGAVTLNAARYVSGVFQQKDANDNLVAVTNHMSNRLVVKGDGRVITNGAAISDPNQLTTKTYVDGVASTVSASIPTIDMYRSSYTFHNSTYMSDGTDSLSASVFSQTYSAAKGIIANQQFHIDVAMDDIHWDTGAVDARCDIIVWYNGNPVRVETVYWHDQGYGGVTYVFGRNITNSTSYSNSTPGTIMVTCTITFAKNTGARGCTVSSNVFTNNIVIR